MWTDIAVCVYPARVQLPAYAYTVCTVMLCGRRLMQSCRRLEAILNQTELLWGKR
jgi:hypothetical protein